jgi:hypothetical protein
VGERGEGEEERSQCIVGRDGRLGMEGGGGGEHVQNPLSEMLKESKHCRERECLREGEKEGGKERGREVERERRREGVREKEGKREREGRRERKGGKERGSGGRKKRGRGGGKGERERKRKKQNGKQAYLKEKKQTQMAITDKMTG